MRSRTLATIAERISHSHPALTVAGATGIEHHNGTCGDRDATDFFCSALSAHLAQPIPQRYFNRVVTQRFGVTFKEQSKIWLQQSQTRKRKPIRTTTVPTIKSALDKWILPELGDLPLSETAKYSPTKSPLTKRNAAGLSAQTVNAYFRMAKAVVQSAEDAEGNPLYERKWDAEKLDLPVVETSKQRRSSITADVMAEFAQTRKPKYRMVFILAASSGCRVGEILGLEVKDLLDDLTTIRVVQQAKGTKLTLNLTTINSRRFVDICPEVAALLKEFLGERTTGLVFSSRTGKPLHPSNLLRRVIHPLLEKIGLPLGGNHIFRRFRLTWLRENSVPSDIERAILVWTCEPQRW